MTQFISNTSETSLRHVTNITDEDQRNELKGGAYEAEPPALGRDDVPKWRIMKRTSIATILIALLIAVGLVTLYVTHGRKGAGAIPPTTDTGKYVRLQQPSMFTYDELVALGTSTKAEGELADKLHAITTTPFLSNEAYYHGAQPFRPKLSQLGSSLRLVTWNIERGLQLDAIKLLFTDTEKFLKQAQRNEPKADIPQMRKDVEVLKSADVIVLNEVDWGLKRTGYRAVVRELGDTLNMNWAYGVEFIEVDPISLGTEKLEEWKNQAERERLLAEIQVDKEQLRALHGTVVLSRYPILEARLKPFQTVGYDWYEGEKKALDPLEKGKRMGAEVAFLEKVSRQIRRGGRTSLIVTLDVPDLTEKTLTVAATHLESNAKPEARQKQMGELLALLRDIHNPVVIAGDLNTSGGDATPTSFKRQIYQRLGSAEFWANTGAKYATGVGALYDVVRGSLNTAKNQDDPTARNIPLVGPNPEAQMFDVLEEFHFRDGFAFDFRGNEDRAVNGTQRTLANSNQRDDKGFATTYEFERAMGIVGKMKLDWILVKSYLKDSRDDDGPYRFAPHFSRTLGSVNYALPARLSDHDPISVDLPFEEPPRMKNNKAERVDPFPPGIASLGWTEAAFVAGASPSWYREVLADRNQQRTELFEQVKRRVLTGTK